MFSYLKPSNRNKYTEITDTWVRRTRPSDGWHATSLSNAPISAVRRLKAENSKKVLFSIFLG